MTRDTTSPKALMALSVAMLGLSGQGSRRPARVENLL